MVLGYTFLTRDHLHVSHHATVLSPHKQMVYCTPCSSRFIRHQLTFFFLKHCIAHYQVHCITKLQNSTFLHILCAKSMPSMHSFITINLCTNMPIQVAA